MTEQLGGLKVRLRQVSPIPLDIAFGVFPGEMLAVVGASGSGKTTILRAIAGLHRPAESHINCNGEIWSDTAKQVFVPARRRRVGMVLQAYALFPHLTAIENVIESLLDIPAGERQDRALAMLASVHLDQMADRLPGQLSGGQQQRVAIARALARRPHVLLLDEPFSALDRPTRRSLQRELLGLRQLLTMPVVLVTHDVRDVLSLADRICVVAAGRAVQTGSVAEVTANPLTPDVADLLDPA